MVLSIIDGIILDHLRTAHRELEAARSLADQHPEGSRHILEVFSNPGIDRVIQAVDDLTWELFSRAEGVAEEETDSQQN